MTPAADKPEYTRGVPPTGIDSHPAFVADKAAALEGLAHGITLPKAEDVTIGEPGCQRCEVLPQPIRGPGTLVLRFPHTHTLGKVLGFLDRSAWVHAERAGTLNVRVGDGSLAPLLGPMLDLMSDPEQRGTRALFRFDGLPDPSAEFEIDSLPRFVARTRSDWLVDILRERRIYPVFQPILRCPEADGDLEVYGYECLARAEVDGETVCPGAMIDLARGAGLLFQFDLVARRAALAGAAGRVPGKIFVNFAPNAIYDPNSCLNSTIRFVDELGLRRDQVVFEIVEGDRLPPVKHLMGILRKYRAEGFEVALDDVGAGYSSVDVMLALRPDYVKLDMGLVRNVHADPDRAVVTRKLLEMAQELGLRTIAEGVETAGELEWVRDHGADFVQGYLFAKPATPPPPVAATAFRSLAAV